MLIKTDQEVKSYFITSDDDLVAERGEISPIMARNMNLIGCTKGSAVVLRKGAWGDDVKGTIVEVQSKYPLPVGLNEGDEVYWVVKDGRKFQVNQTNVE